MKIKKQLKALFFIATILFNISIYSEENDKIDFMQIVKDLSGKLQKSVVDLVSERVEKKDNFSFFNFLKEEEKNYEKYQKKYFLNLEKKAKKVSKEYEVWAISLGTKMIEKADSFIQNKTNSGLNMKPEDRVELDKIGAISGGITAIIITTLKKRSSFGQRIILPVFSGLLVYHLVSTNTEIKEAIYQKIDSLKK